MSWQELHIQAHVWAQEAQRLGIGKDVAVVIYGHKEAAFFIAMAGALLIGAPFVPVDTIYPTERLRRIAYVIFTSGSTGDPKGVQIGRESVALLGEWLKNSFDLGDAPVFMNQAPFSFDLSMYEMFGTLALGGTCVLNSREQIGRGATWITKLAKQEISVWASTPSFAHQQLLVSFHPRYCCT